MERLSGLYKELYHKVYGETKKIKFKETELSNFVAMRGCRYNESTRTRLMIVGRAVNGWGKGMRTDSADTYACDAVKLFENETRYTSSPNEWKMKNTGENPYAEYVKKKDSGENELKRYDLSKSPFWSASKEVWSRLSGEDRSDWYEDIVWNNLYKIAPFREGNPSTNLIYAQAETCVDLLKEEIRLLKPTHVLLVIDKTWISWKSRGKVKFDFMKAFEGYQCQYEKALNGVDQSIVQCAFTVGDCKVLVTCRPEPIGREEYVQNVTKAFKNMQI